MIHIAKSALVQLRQFRLRTALLLVALAAVLLYKVVIPTWEYYSLPAGTRLILTKLNQRATLPATGAMPLGGFLKSIRGASMGPTDNGIAIFIDPAGLAEAGVNIQSPVQVPAGRSAMKAVIQQSLNSRGLDYYVKDGLLMLTSKKAADRAIQLSPKKARRP
jgi:hypothetical protein